MRASLGEFVIKEKVVPDVDWISETTFRHHCPSP
jgi:hypothetical protein